MEKKLCSFQAACFCFDKALCFSTNIDSNECGGPQIIGLRIVAVAKITSGNYQIAIIGQCPRCKKITGVVSGDTEPIPYRLDAVSITEKLGKKIPLIICRGCGGINAADKSIFPEKILQPLSVSA